MCGWLIRWKKLNDTDRPSDPADAERLSGPLTCKKTQNSRWVRLKTQGDGLFVCRFCAVFSHCSYRAFLANNSLRELTAAENKNISPAHDAIAAKNGPWKENCVLSFRLFMGFPSFSLSIHPFGRREIVALEKYVKLRHTRNCGSPARPASAQRASFRPPRRLISCRCQQAEVFPASAALRPTILTLNLKQPFYIQKKTCSSGAEPKKVRWMPSGGERARDKNTNKIVC